MLDCGEQNGSGILYRWGRVPVVLPPSIIGLDSTDGQEKAEESFTLNYANLFMQPAFNELEQLAVDSAGKPKQLSQKQLDSIRRTG